MLVRINSGPRKDQVQDLAPAVARVMIDDGRATLAFPDQFPAAVQSLNSGAPAKVLRKGRHAVN